MFGNPVGTTMTLSPFASVFSEALKGRRSREAAPACFAGPEGFFVSAVARAEVVATRARKMTARERKQVMRASPSFRAISLHTRRTGPRFQPGNN